eukprot:153974_1
MLFCLYCIIWLLWLTISSITANATSFGNPFGVKINDIKHQIEQHTAFLRSLQQLYVNSVKRKSNGSFVRNIVSVNHHTASPNPIILRILPKIALSIRTYDFFLQKYSEDKICTTINPQNLWNDTIVCISNKFEGINEENVMLTFNKIDMSEKYDWMMFLQLNSIIKPKLTTKHKTSSLFNEYTISDDYVINNECMLNELEHKYKSRIGFTYSNDMMDDFDMFQVDIPPGFDILFHKAFG